MTVEKDILGKIRVEISRDDARELGIDLKSYNPNDSGVRLIFRSLYKAAAEKLGEQIDDKRLFIESYPSMTGGGVIVFTSLSRGEIKRIIPKLKLPELFIFDFSSGNELYDAAEIMKKLSKKPIKSQLFDLGDKFRLIVFENDENAPYIALAKEFSCGFSSSQALKKFTYEHGKMLTGEFAIDEIILN